MANFCSNCGTKVDPTWNACPKCGTALVGGVNLKSTTENHTLSYSHTAKKPSSWKKHKHSALALIFANVGLFGVLFTGVGIIFGILAIAFGVIGIRRDEDRSMAVLGIIVGIIDLIFGIFVLVFVISYFANY